MRKGIRTYSTRGGVFTIYEHEIRGDSRAIVCTFDNLLELATKARLGATLADRAVTVIGPNKRGSAVGTISFSEKGISVFYKGLTLHTLRWGGVGE